MNNPSEYPKPQPNHNSLIIAISIGVIAIVVILLWFYSNTNKDEYSAKQQPSNNEAITKSSDTNIELLKEEINALSQKIDNIAASINTSEYKTFTSNGGTFSLKYPSNFTIIQEAGFGNKDTGSGNIIRAGNSTLPGSPAFTLAVNPEYGVPAFSDNLYSLDLDANGNIVITEETNNQLLSESSPEIEGLSQDTINFYTTNKTFRAELLTDKDKYIFGAIIQRDSAVDYEEQFERFITSLSITENQ